jgi:hypothetical protein
MDGIARDAKAMQCFRSSPQTPPALALGRSGAQGGSCHPGRAVGVFPIPDFHRAIISGEDAISLAWSADGPVLANHGARTLSMVPVERSICRVMMINLTAAFDNPNRAPDTMTDAVGPELQQAMAARVIYSPVDAARKLDAAALARTARRPLVLGRGMKVNSVAVDKLVDRLCHDWRDRNLIDR